MAHNSPAVGMQLNGNNRTSQPRQPGQTQFPGPNQFPAQRAVPSSISQQIGQNVDRDWGKLPFANQTMHSPQSPPYDRSSLPQTNTHNNMRPLSVDRGPKQSAEVFDLRDVNMTEAYARTRLSGYSIIRIEKTRDPYDLDEEGNLAPPTWKRASYRLESGISQQEATRKVRELDREGKLVANKKDDLPLDIQEHIDHAQDSLESKETDPRYGYTLAQLDCKLKRVHRSADEDERRDKRRSDKRHTKSKKEIVAVKAYFKRAPRQNENCVRMLQDEERERHARESSPYEQPSLNNHVQHPRQNNQIPPSLNTQHRPFPMPIPTPNPHSQASAPPGSHPSHQPPTLPSGPLPKSQGRASSSQTPPSASSSPNIRKNLPQKDTATRSKSPKGNKDTRKLRHQASVESLDSHSSSSSRGSSSSSASSKSSKSSKYSTPHSFTEYDRQSSRGKHKGQNKHRKPREKTEVFGEDVPRRHGHSKRHHRHRSEDSPSLALSLPPPAPDPLTTTIDLDMLIERERIAYGKGIIYAQKIAARTAAAAALSPRIIQEQPPAVRNVPVYMSRHHMPEDDYDQVDDHMDRMPLEDDRYRSRLQHRGFSPQSEPTRPARPYRDEYEDEVLTPGSNSDRWQRQEQRYYSRQRPRPSPPSESPYYQYSDRRQRGGGFR